MPAAAIWIRRLTLAGFLLCLVVVVLGAYVRLTAAGLGCPDWPGCYGHLTPAAAEQNPQAQAAWPGTPFDVGKAWREMIHRYAASTLGLIIMAITAIAIASRQTRPMSPVYALVLLATVVFQGILGMLTVTWQLKPLVVTLHLLFGLTTLSLLWWLWLSLTGNVWSRVSASDRGGFGSRAVSSRARLLTLTALVALGLQIALGGWTSSNYAAVACPDFPTCQGQWWPATDFDDAFVLWRGLGVNYEGGVLDQPARVAIHLTHRIGAIVASLALVAAAVVTLQQSGLRRARAAAVAVLGALVLQLLIGIFMVIKAFPLWLATAHNAGAALLLLTAVTLHRRVRDAHGR